MWGGSWKKSRRRTCLGSRASGESQAALGRGPGGTVSEHKGFAEAGGPALEASSPVADLMWILVSMLLLHISLCMKNRELRENPNINNGLGVIRMYLWGY